MSWVLIKTQWGVEVKRAGRSTLHILRETSVLQYGSNIITKGAKAITDNPYSVILKRAKNTWTNGRVLVSLSGLRTVVLKFKRQYCPLFRDRGHIEAHCEVVLDSTHKESSVLNKLKVNSHVAQW